MVSIDPGEVDTDLFRREPGDDRMRYLQTEVAPKRVKPIAVGVRNQLWAATGHGLTSGLHYEPVGKYAPEGLMLDEQLAKEVWEWTQRELEGQEL
jgi:retinol dehydrogenase-12